MKHLIIRDGQLNGWEYGMLRSFENAIQTETGAVVADIPAYTFAARHLHRFGHGMNKAGFRKYLPKQPFQPPPADVAWLILMGPENYNLDLFTGWEKAAKTKVLYLYDTLPAQYPVIKKLFSDGKWDVLITSFDDAVDDLNKLTGRKWSCIPQAADTNVFKPVPLDEKLIHFSAYGRRYPVLHEALTDFCKVHGLYYDYTTHDGKHPTADAPDLYKQYGWHLSHSLFTFSWPVELTNPARAGHLRPITCRWFEAAAAGTIILGQKPGNPAFTSFLADGLVQEIDYNGDKASLFRTLESVYDNREALFEKAAGIRSLHLDRWTWEQRVRETISLISS